MKSRKALLTPVPTYNIEILGKTFVGFTKSEEWEGMAKFTNPQGVVILNIDAHPMADFFSAMAKGVDAEAKEYLIIKVSPVFIDHAGEEADAHFFDGRGDE